MDNETDILYHATKSTDVFREFETPTGLSKLDVTTGGVIYSTTDPDRAIKYAGGHGQIVVCRVDPRKAIPYKLQLERQGLSPKKGKYTREVFVTLPKDISPVIFFNPVTFKAIMDANTE